MDYTINFKDGSSTFVEDAPCFGGMNDGMPYDEENDCDSPESDEAVSCVFHVSSLDSSHSPLATKAHKIIFDHHHEILPQFFGNCDWRFDSSNSLVDFEAPMGENSIQTTMFALRSVRNIFGSTGQQRMFVMSFEKTGNANLSFLLAQAFYVVQGFRDPHPVIYHFNDNDSSVLDSEFMRVDDFKHLLNGGIGYEFQGRWCDSTYGYGNYGGWKGRDTPAFERTNRNARLFSNSLMEELPDEPGRTLREIRVPDQSFDKYIEVILKALE